MRMELLVVGSLLLVSGPVVNNSREPAELTTLRAAYKESLNKLDDTYYEQLREAPKTHLKALEELEKRYQSAGELKPLLAVREERLRFEKNPRADAITLVAAPDKLRALQEQYIQTLKDLELNRARSILDLTQKYVTRLTQVQKDLTRQGRIDEALKVLAEAEAAPNSELVLEAKRKLEGASSGTVQPPSRKPSASGTINPGEICHGEIIGWNSVTGELTCRYDFSKEEQLADWEGGIIDPVGRLVCRNAVVWHKIRFKSVSRMEYEGYLFSGEGPIRMTLGNSLFADMGGGANHAVTMIYQTSEHHPFVTLEQGVDPALKYTGLLTLRDNTVVWEVNGRRLAPGQLQVPIPSPVRVGFGTADTLTKFDNVVITGILDTSGDPFAGN